MRFVIRTSKWAIWARRLASLALPLTLVPYLIYRGALIGFADFLVLMVLATAIAGLALLCGLVAVVWLWFSGDRGWGRAIGAIVLGGLCLVPAGFVGFEYLRYPAITDISTDPADPPPLVQAPPANAIVAATVPGAAEAFPHAQLRQYQLSSSVLFVLAKTVATNQDWTIRIETPPDDAGNDGLLEAEEATLLGWTDAVTVRFRENGNAVDVAVRSATLVEVPHDLGTNGRRIEAFLTALDDAVSNYLRDMPADDDDSEPAPPTDDAATGEENPPAE